MRRPITWRRRRQPESWPQADTTRAKHLRDDGVVMNRVTYHEQQLATEGRARRDHRAAMIELRLDQDVAFQAGGIKVFDPCRQLAGRSPRRAAIGLDGGVTGPAIVGTQARLCRREQGAHVVEAMTDMPADSAGRPARCRHRVLDIVESLD